MFSIQPSFPSTAYYLNINRQGHLTDSQHKILQAGYDDGERTALFLRRGAGIAGSLCVSLAVLFSNLSLLLFGAGLLFVFVTITIYAHHNLVQLNKDLESSEVMAVEGAVVYVPHGRNVTLKIDDVALRFASWKMYRTLSVGTSWRVFYLPQTKIIVSVEPLTKPRNPTSAKT